MQREVSSNMMKELVQYYMEFLENGFKVGQIPSRRIEKQEGNEGIALSLFPKMEQEIKEAFRCNFTKTEGFQVKEQDHSLTFTKEEQKKILEAEETEFPLLLKKILLSKEQIKKRKAESILSFLQEQKEVRGESFANFLSHYKYLHLFEELKQLWIQKQTVEQQDVYLYFMPITYQNTTFPLFYMRYNLVAEGNGTSISLEPAEHSLFVNKKAMEYLNRKYNETMGTHQLMPLPLRQIHIGQFEKEGELVSHLQEIVSLLCKTFAMQEIDILGPNERADNGIFSLQNDFLFALGDKSDEMILNDYEDFLHLLSQGEESEGFSQFQTIIHDFLFQNPISVNQEIERTYDEKNVSERFSYYSPISLNKEQQQVLDAIFHPNGERIVIEGPPGTGKSHTIAAIMYHALLQGKSVLMVSDKQEALDVVEDKINQTLDRMKLDDFVQNPVLRLGSKNSNYHKIFQSTNFSKIKSRHHAYQKKKDSIEKEIEDTLDKIQKDIQQEVTCGKEMSMETIETLIKYEPVFHQKWKRYFPSSWKEEQIETWKKSFQRLKHIRMQIEQVEELGFLTISPHETFQTLQDKLNKLVLPIQKLETQIEKEAVVWHLLSDITKEKRRKLESILSGMEELKGIFGFLFKGQQVKQYQDDFQNLFVFQNLSLKETLPSLQVENRIYKIAEAIEEECHAVDMYAYLKGRKEIDISSFIKEWNEHVTVLFEEKQGLHVPNELDAFLRHPFLTMTTEEQEALFFYLEQVCKVEQVATTFGKREYTKDRERLEERLVHKMTNILDQRVIQFLEENRNDANTIKQQFQKKKKISKEQLRQLVTAFPCLIVGIREIGEYIPLEANLFDVVIIDEASQVSIAQAFPAILRAKKVVVLGDSKQFSNVKANQAAKKVNQTLFQRIQQESVGNEQVLDKLENFNIKNSILEFMKNIANYHTVLKKHFRGYYELIQYSNQHFYDGALEVMKIRSKPIQDVLQFHVIEPYEKEEVRKNTNEKETEWILKELVRLKEEGYKGSIGIITPFAEQQKWMTKKIMEHMDYEYFKRTFQLKIMTFDSCQGEERDIIYYSMVEKQNQKKLIYIFPKNLEENEDNQKSQRLNVGFSRAKESIRFVMSKEVTEFEGEIGNALRYFKSLTKGKDHCEVLEQTDKNSPMEKKLYQWVIQTPFYQKHQDKIEIVPQFEMGKYIRQLDSSFTLPNYKVDFLMNYYEEGKTKTVILEYDGFEYHFQKDAEVNAYTYQYLYTEDDVERQKIIESYGYPFVRMNKFIVREDPIAFLEKEFQSIFKPIVKEESALQEEIQEMYQKIQNKEMKLCGKCKEMKELEEFYDEALVSKYGRNCMMCKKQKISS